MNLCAWTSNNEQFQNTLPHALRTTQRHISVLGLIWDTYNNTLTVPVPAPLDPEIQPTLHLILQQSAKVYDILGLWSPITIKPKILMQELHLNNYQWDTPLLANLTERWRQIEAEFHQLGNTLILCQIADAQIFLNEKTELHVFADASKQAYAAAVYGRIPEEDRFVTHLLFSKAKITKLTANYTILQLELLAAVIAAR